MGNGTEMADPDQTNMYKADGAICLILSLISDSATVCQRKEGT